MILYWKDSNYAKYLKLGVSVMGIIYEGKRPDVVILTKKEVSTPMCNNNPVTGIRNIEYHQMLQRVSSTPNVIVAK